MLSTRERGALPGDEVSRRLVELYRAAEEKISAKLMRALAQSGDKKNLTVRSLEQQHKAVKKMLKSLLKDSKAPIDELVETAFNGGIAVSRKELKAGLTDITFEMQGINAKMMKVYAEQIYSRMADVVQSANRTTTDIYRALKLNSVMGGAVGGYDSIDSVRRDMQKISSDNGITAFIDKRGRKWNMATYCEMLARTSTAQIFHQGKTNEYLAHGEDLVIVTHHTPTCDKCAKWGGKVLSLTGETKGYPTIDEARAAGLFHPNCRHTYSLYMEFDDETDNNPFALENEEKSALNRYVSSDSYKINEKLRTRSQLTDEEKQFVSSLDKALGKMPDYQGTVYRNITLDMVSDEEFDSFIRQHSVGSFIGYEGYTSTSKDKEGYTIDGNKIVSITMNVKQGKDINHFGYGVPEEQEVLLERGAKFEITKAQMEDGKLFLTMEEKG